RHLTPLADPNERRVSVRWRLKRSNGCWSRANRTRSRPLERLQREVFPEMRGQRVPRSQALGIGTYELLRHGGDVLLGAPRDRPLGEGGYDLAGHVGGISGQEQGEALFDFVPSCVGRQLAPRVQRWQVSRQDDLAAILVTRFTDASHAAIMPG